MPLDIASVNFNPRSDERSDLCQYALRYCFGEFQSTLRRTERRGTTVEMVTRNDFNPRSDERSDYLLRSFQSNTSISIHAPTNGATCETYVVMPTVDNFNPRSDERSDNICNTTLHITFTISIHAPTNGATKMTIINKNPRYISIHAPTNGATRQPMYKGYGCRHFNPRSDERSDSDSVIDPQSTVVFQSTLRRTERPQLLAAVTFSAIISIHAPTNGATNSVAVPLCDDTISIHAPTNGATST